MKKSPVGTPKKKKTQQKASQLDEVLLSQYQDAIVEKNIVQVCSLEDDVCSSKVRQYISTQSLGLDKLLNGKGVPTGRVTEIYGPPHIGKSTILDHLFASVQKINGVGVLFDTETARDSRYTASIGVDVSKLQIIEFTPEELHIENIMRALYRTLEWWTKNGPNVPVIIGWDALGGTATRDELKKRLEKDAKPAAAAQIMRTASRQLPPKLGSTNAAVVILNHEYQTFGMGQSKPRKETYGGGAIRHLASIRVRLHNAGYIKRGDHIVGRKVGAFLEKNKLGNPFTKTEVALLSGIGIDNVWTVYETLKEANIIAVKGSWSAINLDNEVLNFQGWNGLTEKCKEDETLFPRLVSVYESLG